MTYDLKSDWYDWYINNKPMNNQSMHSFLDQDGMIYSVKVHASQLPKNVSDVREESEAYLDNIVKTCGFNKFAVLVSGIDSEIIARYLSKKKLDLKIYHTKFWFKNDTDSNIIKEIAKNIDAPYEIVNYDWKKDKHSIVEILSETLCPSSVKSTHIHTIRNIPKDRYIFTGCTNFEKDQPQYFPNQYSSNNTICYMDTRQLSNRYTLNLLKRHGCSVFWFNDKRTTSAMLRDKRTFIKKNGELYNEQIFKDLWGDECLFKEKTLPFGNTHGSSYIEGSNTYKWEYRYPEHWRNRGKAIAMIQQRYLRMKYGVLNSVVNDKVNNNSVWQFGSTLDINKIL